MRRPAMTLLLSLASVTVFTVAPASAANPVTATPKKLVFGDVPTGNSVTMDVTFTNNGSTDLYFSGWAICPCPGATTAFQFNDDFLNNDPTSCAYLAPLSLPAGGSCAAEIIFSPTNQQPYHAVLTVLFGVSEGAQDYTVDVKLSGKGS